MAIGMLPQYDLSNQAYKQKGTNIAIIDSATDAQRLAAWMFISYLTNTENGAEWALLGNRMPVRYSSFETDIYQDFLNNPSTNDLSQGLNNAYNQIGNYQFEPAFYNGPTGFSSYDLREKAEDAILLLLAGGYTTSEIIADILDN